VRGLVLAAAFAVYGAVLLGMAGAAGKPTLTTPSIDSGPDALTQLTSATFTFTTNEPNPDATLACRLDDGAWATCASPYDLPAPIADGPHVFEVRAVIGDPNDPTERSRAANRTWTIDSTPPSLPGDTAVEATSPAGAVVEFPITDNIDPLPQVSCDHQSGETFPIGATAVTCTAADAAGNQSQGQFTITVADTIAPALGPHADVVVFVKQGEAEADVSSDLVYDPALVFDAADPAPTITCSPSGSSFPLGRTTVSCEATDASGNVSDPDEFDVLVQEGAAPPMPTLTDDVESITNETSVTFTFSAEAGLTLDCRLQGPGQNGEFEACQSDTEQSYSGLEDGSYLFTLRVSDSIGNINESNLSWRVDTTPPGRVNGFRTHGGNGWVKLRWSKPDDAGYDHVLIRRKRASDSTWTTLGKRRNDTSIIDWNARNDVLYTYSIRSVDEAGNGSVPALARGRASRILSPQFDAVLSRPPLIDWVTVRRASYYNLQIWRNDRKILSVWPSRSERRLEASWTYNGKRYTLSGDRYRVFVWPGFGSKLSADYGSLIGWSAFVMR